MLEREWDFLPLKAWNGQIETCLQIGNYCRGERLAVELLSYQDGYYGEYATLTVNLVDAPSSGPFCSFVDVNNFPQAQEFLEGNGLAQPTGLVGFSGMCAYPEYRFDLEAMKAYLTNLYELEEVKKSARKAFGITA